MCDKQSSSDNDNQSSDSQTLADVVKKSVASVIGTNNDFQTVGKKRETRKLSSAVIRTHVLTFLESQEKQSCLLDDLIVQCSQILLLSTWRVT